MGAKKLDDIQWESQPGSQTLFLCCPVFECLFEGTRGPGKTDSLIIDFIQDVGKGDGADWRGILFRQEYKELADVVKKSKQIINNVFTEAKFYEAAIEYKWKWPSGEQLLFRHGKKEDDYWAYHGHEYPWQGWEELTSWPDNSFYEAMKSCCRSSNPDVPRKIRSTANPWGKGHHWVKAYFVDPAPAGTILYDEQGRARCRVSGFIFENKFIVENDPEYILNIFGQKDENKRKAWAFADWDIAAGGFFSDFWNASRHIIPPFVIPSTWKMGCSFDWGSAKPASLGIWAVSNGDQPKAKNLPFFPRGSAIRLDELYTVKYDKNGAVEANIGTEYTNNILGQKIGERLKHWEQITGIKFTVNFADPSIWTESGGDSIYTQLVGNSGRDGQKKTGARAVGYNLRFEKADNSREAGWGKVKLMLEESDKERAEAAGLWIVKRCKNFIRTVPVIQRDDKNPDDLDTEAEDHIADEARYFLMSMKDRKATSTKMKGF